MIYRGSGGAIVNVSSVASRVALAEHTVYCASKGALDQVTRVMALELGPHKVSNTNACTVISQAHPNRAWCDTGHELNAHN